MAKLRGLGTVVQFRAQVVVPPGLYRAGIYVADAALDVNGAPLPLDTSEQKVYTNWLAEQSAYVSRLSNELNTTEELNADYRASLWGNKSLMSIYQAGLISADKNGMYRWELGKTEKHCKDCSRLSGQVHRLKDYQRRRLLPNSDTLECTGMNCDCNLIKTTECAKGRF